MRRTGKSPCLKLVPAKIKKRTQFLEVHAAHHLSIPSLHPVPQLLRAHNLEYNIPELCLFPFQIPHSTYALSLGAFRELHFSLGTLQVALDKPGGFFFFFLPRLLVCPSTWISRRLPRRRESPGIKADRPLSLVCLHPYTSCSECPDTECGLAPNAQI